MDNNMIFILFQMKTIDDEGQYTVSFLKEKEPGFYIAKSQEDGGAFAPVSCVAGRDCGLQYSRI